ncbi:acetolactate synthase 2 catalytic subunit [Salinisphaera sp. Q1T1-3]|uniref:acetolactate synthase 2 catalytic subunit n=1 Tax=Salinisphaera sp. Q1T1-3 TaxID=2321229 RepID=UPI000E73E445|nr:acetolactate synthase 2 catalytic subunit [Salinisphaera sp. Q1T1-3]RJS93060.1 acetolactate synthase 2 catalytic subunit [Salinisphaera sp. Q1T1-3]
MNAAHQILDVLTAHDIDTVFGYPGGCVMPLYDALVDHPAIRHVLCRHEQGCALAADGYARASGRLGVCIATSGPGATNLVTGVANAHRDSIPMLVITGQTPSAAIGTDAFQEVDVLGMTLDIVKHSRLVQHPDELAAAVAEGIEIATRGRGGPVWLDVPKDVLAAATSEPAIEVPRHVPGPIGPRATERDLARILAMLRTARRPLLYTGGGVARAGAEPAMRDFAARSGLPAVTSLNGIGNAGHRAPDDLGMLGMHGSRAANQAVDACDVLFVIGARMDDRATGALSGFAPNARIVHIDIDAAELHKRRAVEIGVHADLGDALTRLTEALTHTPLSIAAWRRQCREWHARHGFAAALSRSPRPHLTGPDLIHALSEACRSDTVVACDVGQHQMWVAQHFDFGAPRNHLSSGGLGTMGYGLPAAIGAAFARPDAAVLNIAGDGSFMMNVQELATIRRHDLPVKIVVLDNACLGMVRQQQALFHDNRESQIALDDNPDFSALAAAFGIPASRVTTPGELAAGLEGWLHAPGPALLHAHIVRNDNVWPMVAPGAANRDMLDATHLPAVETAATAS